MKKIYVDADACPVKYEIIKVATRHKIRVFMVCNGGIRPFRNNLINLIIVLGIGQWVTYARIARAQTISQKEKEYVEAAKALGVNNFSIMFGSILPNIFAPLIVIASFNVASVILAEAALSFLGLGVPPQIPTWGAMLAESRDHIFAKRWWMPFFPGMAILLKCGRYG